MARFGEDAGIGPLGAIVPPGDQAAVLAALPVAALRLTPAQREDLNRLGLRRIGALLALPRAGLAARFGNALPRRLDQALGHVDEPVSPRRPAPVLRLRLAFPEPVAQLDAVKEAARRLLAAMDQRLEATGRGARRLELALYRTSGQVDTVAAGTSRPSRAPDHLMRLLAEQLDRLPETGALDSLVDLVILAVQRSEPLTAAQDAFADDPARRGADPAALAALVDRLSSRLGAASVIQLQARESHVPERAQVAVPAPARPLGGNAVAGPPPPRPHGTAAAPPVAAAGACHRRGSGARRSAGAVPLAWPRASRRPRRWARTDRPGMVAHRRRHHDPRLLPDRGHPGAALLALPPRALPARLGGRGRRSAAMVPARPLWVTAMCGYVELQVTTNFTFLRGASHPEELAQAAAHLGHAAVAITDRNTLAGVVRAHVAAKQAGIRLVVGAHLACEDGPPLLCLPTDRAAYARLTRLLTLGKRRVEKAQCRLFCADVVSYGEGQLFIVLPPDAPDEAFVNHLKEFAAAFKGRCYLAAWHRYGGGDSRRLAALAALAAACGTPLVATNDVHAHAANRRPLQDVLTCIREHCTIGDAGYRLAANAERHLKPADEMRRLFRGYEDAVAPHGRDCLTLHLQPLRVALRVWAPIWCPTAARPTRSWRASLGRARASATRTACRTRCAASSSTSSR